LVFVDQAAESVAATEPIEWEHLAWGSLVGCCGWGERRPLAERAVRPVLVVVDRVDRHNPFKMAATDDQQPVETFATEAPASARQALAAAVPAPAP
jgi:hypothetical protein